MLKCETGRLIQRRKGGEMLYYVRLNLREVDEAGKTIRYTTKDVSTGLPVSRKNKSRAEAMIQDLIAKYNATDGGEGELIEDYCMRWVEEKRPTLERTTYDGYCFRALRIKKFFSGKRLTLSSLKPQDVKAFYTWMSTTEIHRGTKVYQGYGNRTLKDTASFLCSILDEAVDLELIPKNPAKRVKIPQRPSDRGQRAYIAADQIPAFLEEIRGHRLETLFLMALTYGMRREELLGLRWSAIRDGKIYVEHVVTEWRTLEEKDRAKTEAGHRCYALIPEIKKKLEEIRLRQAHFRKQMGAEYHESDFVFTWEDGRLYRPDYVSKSFRKLVKKSDRLDSRLTLHSLRASCVSILIHSGADIKDTQVYVGHADVSTTMDIYARTNDRQQAETAERMAAAIFSHS